MVDEEITPNPVHVKRKRPGRALFFKTPAGRKLAKRFREEYSGRPQPSKLGWAGSRAVTDWELAKRVTRGEIVEGMKRSAVDMRAKSLGLGYGTAFFCDQGEPLRDASLQSLRERLGFTTARFEKLTGLGPKVADKRAAAMIRGPRDARIVIEWRDKTLRSLLAATSPAYKNHRILKTFLPEIADLDGLLRDRFAEIQKTMRADFTLAHLGDFVCEQVRRSAKKTPHAGLWGEMLRCLVELDACRESRTFLEANLGSLRHCKALADFVREIIGARYGTTAWTITRALLRSTQPYSDAEMRGFVLDIAPVPTATQIAPAPVAPPKPKKISERTVEKGRFCAQIQNEMRKIKALSVGSGLTIVEIQLAQPDFTVWKLRDTLTEENREHFNHPHRWAPVIGYARAILGKHFESHPFTVRDWVKAYRAESRKARA
jgi:hypothetical protein